MTGYHKSRTAAHGQNASLPFFDGKPNGFFQNPKNPIMIMIMIMKTITRMITRMKTRMITRTITRTKTKTRSGTAHPTREEVHEYVKQRNSSVDPDRFFDFYTADDDPAKHWIDSKGHPVANWKQKLISWERRETDAGRSNSSRAEDSTESGAAKWGNLYS